MKKSFKSIICILVVSCLINVIPLNVSASDLSRICGIERLNNGYYYETVIQDVETPSSILSNVNYITKTKTTSMKNSNGDILWSLSIKATFSYDGTTATCTSCSHGYTIASSAWSLKNATSTRSGNSATASVTAIHTLPSGNTQTYKKSVTITCSPTGVVS